MHKHAQTHAHAYTQHTHVHTQTHTDKYATDQSQDLRLLPFHLVGALAHPQVEAFPTVQQHHILWDQILLVNTKQTP